MTKKKKVGKWIALAVVLAIALAGVLFLKQYYDLRYAPDDDFYTVVPLDYDITPYNDEQGGRLKDYSLTGYNAEGEAKDLVFTVFVDAHGADLYPPGTYLKVSVSKQMVLNCRALDVANVPAGALERIQASFVPSAATTLSEYAAERTQQLSVKNKPSLQVSCTVSGTTLVYTYEYTADMQAIAESDAFLLDPVYVSQFRTDKQAFDELTAIVLEVRLDDGTIIFSQKYNTRVEFTYELQ
ncbi:MAG: hypothetical protein FWE41_05885 [Coriobacteriia bacterium]|nr:hypothetical protein [Coriobacteriia bacterium]MCL2749956.1 hypothetical protein [Coriobacteriia bacterium]